MSPYFLFSLILAICRNVGYRNMIHGPAKFVNLEDSSSHMGHTLREEPAEMARNGDADLSKAGESPWKFSIDESRGTRILSLP